MGCFFAGLAAEVLGVAGWVGAVDVADAFFVAVAAAADDGGVDVVDGDADALVEDVAFAIVVFAAGFGVFTILDDAAEQLVDIFESFLDEETTKLLASDPARAVG